MCVTCIVQHENFSFCVFFFFLCFLFGGGEELIRKGAGKVEKKKIKKKIQMTQIEFQYKEKNLEKKRNKDVKGMVLFWSFDVCARTLY